MKLREFIIPDDLRSARSALSLPPFQKVENCGKKFDLKTEQQMKKNKKF